ncbi:MAG: beta-ketoacyl synthase N-terminal-like domain-containing protein [Candidatus Promineifilaceae bacterium]|nr:beta-ketoacyl synthase N-terminal-like domain-containing protein [Candidatus Promineifilaceae bacterium]
MRSVSIVATAQLPVQKQHNRDLRELGADVVRSALAEAGAETVDALYLANMLADELQSQKHLAALVADEAGLAGVEALQVRAATAGGAAALRVAYMAVASGSVETAVVVGVEKMSDQSPVLALAKALDARYEVPDAATMLSQNARLMALYCQQVGVGPEVFANFAVNAHRNANHNPCAMFQDKEVTVETVLESRMIVPPIRLYDCAPICDGAAAVVLAPSADAHRFTDTPVRLLASACITDRFRMADRPDPLRLAASEQSAAKALHHAGLDRYDVDFFELHDAFSIMSCLQLEAVGFAPRGQGWRLAVENEIGLDGRIPITTMGGLKARGHPIGATALYQTCEIVLQLTGGAGANQLPSPSVGMLQSVGGVGSTILTHIFAL